MKEGDLPSRDGSTTEVNCNRAQKRVLIDVNGSREELSLSDAVALVGKISAMVEVMLMDE